MLTKDYFQDVLTDFSKRFKDHSYDTYLINLLYDDLNYLKSDQLDYTLAFYFKEINKNYFLPSHKIVVDLAQRLFKRPQMKKEKQEIKPCELCFSSGIIKAKHREHVPTKYFHFQCVCDHGKPFGHLSQWNESRVASFISEYEYYQSRPKIDLSDVMKKLEGEAVRGELPDNLKQFKTLSSSLMNNINDLATDIKKEIHDI